MIGFILQHKIHFVKISYYYDNKLFLKITNNDVHNSYHMFINKRGLHLFTNPKNMWLAFPFKTYTRVVRKVCRQSDLRLNYRVLCRVTYVLLNDNQWKISMQNSYGFEVFIKIYSDFYLHELDLWIIMSNFHDVR